MEAQYSDEARIARLEGEVVVSAVVGEDAHPSDIRLLRSLGLGLDEQALATVQQWTFDPGTKDGKPVAVQANFALFFHTLRDLRDWHLEHAAFEVPDGSTRPKLKVAKYPPPSGPEAPSAVTVSIQVNEKGMPVELNVEKSSDEKWNREVLRFLRDWRFQPGMKDGKPLAVSCTLSFVRGSHSPIPPTRALR